MKSLFIIFATFILGCILCTLGGADGTWENMTLTSWIGLVVIMLSVLAIPINMGIRALINLFKKDEKSK